ncbi:cell division site-positioning protein MapZ family protein [Lactococcus kimchii]|uniref:cell division site-positioning protein MapZ family protein n=1 Tax=Lactococcus sp. S-13 TaxID=2507158 RepID=UPI001023AB32|nr:cell division site-positioning protein MapZ family protein [Lactococcus sp. S-13]RZI48883.1 hypothetical protein EQJ87_05195 [Lactococcus sp. S-13]
MSKKNKNKNKNNKNKQQIGEKSLKLQDLQELTVGEIVEKSKQVDKENEENESILDKYIRQHRGEIEEAKSKKLDEFIQSERQSLGTAPSEENSAPTHLATDEVDHSLENSAPASDEKTEVPDSARENADASAETAADNAESILSDGENTDVTSPSSPDAPSEEKTTDIPAETAADSAESILSAGENADVTSPSAADAPSEEKTTDASAETAADSAESILSAGENADANSPSAADAPSEEKTADETAKASSTAPVVFSANHVPLDEPSSDEQAADAPTDASEFADVFEPIPAIKQFKPLEKHENKAKSKAIEPVETPAKLDHFDPVRTADSVDLASKSEEADSTQIDPVEVAETTESTNSVAPIAVNPAAPNAQALPERQAKKQPNKRRTPIIIGVCALVLIAAAAVGFAQHNANNKPKTVQTARNNSDLAKFKTDYAAFFTDSSQKALKNSQFDKFPQLEKLVNSHQTSTAWSGPVAQTKALKTEIAAIKEVNALFDKSVISDGKLDTSAQVLPTAQIPEVPKTENEDLNKLLTQAIALAKTQSEKASSASAEASAASSSAAAQASASASQQAANAAANASNVTSSSTSTTQAPATSSSTQNASANAGTTTQAGATSVNGVTLDSANARVQVQAGLNANDPAFTWGEGILNMVLEKCRARDYITGNAYILQPAAIHTTNGTQGFPAGIVSGYYNLYAPDGSYLLSINAKTGYFVGNGAGHADDLDY